MFQGSYANALRFDCQLYDFHFGSIHTFLFIFTAFLYVWALGL